MTGAARSTVSFREDAARPAGCARARASLTAAHVRARFDHARAVELARGWGYARKASPRATHRAYPPRDACSFAATALARGARWLEASAPAAPARTALRIGHRPHQPPFVDLTAAPARAARPSAGPAAARTKAARG